MIPVLLFGVLGLWVGVLLNGLVHALSTPVAQRSFSFCPNCEAKPAGWDWVPVVGYALRRGRCAACGARRPLRTVLLELATGTLFVLLWRSLGPSVLLPIYTLFVCILEVVFVIDLEQYRIPDRLVWPGVALALLVIPVRAWITVSSHGQFAGAEPSFLGGSVSPWATGMLDLLLGGLVGVSVLAILWLISSGGIGLGDVKLALLAGLVVGISRILWVIFGSAVIGGIVAAALLVSRRATRKSEIPFGPCIVLATIVVLLYGHLF